MSSGDSMAVETRLTEPHQGGVQPPPDLLSRRGFLSKDAIIKLVGAATAAKLMPPNVISPPESRVRFTEVFNEGPYKIDFQPGAHPNEAHLQTARGSMDSFMWNIEVLERIKEEKPGPKVLTIDGVVTSWGEGYNFWSHLPGTPSDIHDSGSVYVVATEQLMHRAPAFTGEIDRSVSSAFTQRFSKDSESISHHGNEDQMMDTVRNVLLLAGGVQLARTITEMADTRPTRITPADKAVKKGLTRRRLLGIGALGALGLAAGQIGGKIGEARSKRILDTHDATTNDRKNRLSREIDILSPRAFIEDSWLDARNAKYVLSTKDSMDALEKAGKLTPDDKATIVAGFSHTIGMNRLMRSNSACVEVLQRYAKGLFNMVDRCVEKDPSLNGPAIKEKVVEIMSQVDIYEARDMNPLDPNPNNRRAQAINRVAHGISPRVFNALSPLLRDVNVNHVGIIFDSADQPSVSVLKTTNPTSSAESAGMDK